MNKSDKIREHFRKFPDAEVAKVAAKFQAPKAMTYKLRKQVLDNLCEDEREPEVEAADVDETLDERAKDYGRFKDSAALMQGIKRLLADHARMHNKTFADDQWEALEMIVHKIGRIVNGNSDKVDSWVDIAGYATLIADRLQGNAR
jgi:hypothetical protein